MALSVQHESENYEKTEARLMSSGGSSRRAQPELKYNPRAKPFETGTQDSCSYGLPAPTNHHTLDSYGLPVSTSQDRHHRDMVKLPPTPYRNGQVQGHALSDTFHSAFQPAQHYQSQQQHQSPTNPTSTPSSTTSHAPTPSFSMQDGLSGYPGWGDFSPFPTPTQGATSTMQRNMTTGGAPLQALSSSTSSSSFRSPQQPASFFNDGSGSMRVGGGMSSEIPTSISHHQQHQQVPAFGQDGGGDKFGLNSSCSSDKFSTLDDMVSKIVDEESNLFSLNSLGHFSTAGTTTTADDSHSQATSDVFSFDESPSLTSGSMWSTGTEEAAHAASGCSASANKSTLSDHHGNSSSSYGNFEQAMGFPMTQLWDDHYADSGIASSLHSQGDHIFSPSFSDLEPTQQRERDLFNNNLEGLDDPLLLQKFLAQLQISGGLLASANKVELNNHSMTGSGDPTHTLPPPTFTSS